MTETTPAIAKPKLILLECDPSEAARFARPASRNYDVITERDADKAVMCLTEDLGVTAFVAGSAADRQSPLNILERVRAARSEVLRVILAAPNDLSIVVAGLHNGLIDRVVHKPVDEQELLAVLPATVRPRTGLSVPLPASAAGRRGG